ncbi:hypothetical protein CVS27_09380 [Arthrobacter glacialis]|uniref:Enamine deaminase RidA n=2 Tax=Arthrobacter glacialis TaxID=1664 RepID=A0A2S3ZWW3_ARTGL|nr:hypothetical protein CVS27_09380 [Arthrobacter glacialis]
MPRGINATLQISCQSLLPYESRENSLSMPEHRFSPLLHQSTAPFSHFVRHGDTGYTAGIIGQRTDDGSLVSDDFALQCEAMVNNLKTLLGELSLSLSNVLRTTIYLTAYKDLEAINAALPGPCVSRSRSAPQSRSRHSRWVRRIRSTPSSGSRTHPLTLPVTGGSVSEWGHEHSGLVATT